jgi:sugar lactone lactonase YvrE
VAFGDVAGLVVDRTGNLLVADATALTVRRIAPDGVVSTLAGGGSVPMRSSGALLPDGRKARDVGFGTLDGIAVDAQGRVYVADAADAAVVRIGTDGLVKVVVAQRDGVTGGDHVGAGQATVTALGSIVADRFGSLFFEDGTSLRRITGL